MENKPKLNTVLLVIITILLAVGLVYLFSGQRTKKIIKKEVDTGKYLSIDDLYKICNKLSCPSETINVDASIISNNSGEPQLVSIENGQRRESITLKPLRTMTVLDKYNLMNRDGYFLGNGILNIKIRGKIKYEPIFFDRLTDHISIYFNPIDIEIVSEGGCLTNGYPYSGGEEDCFKKINYNIEPNDAYSKLIESKLYKDALTSWINSVKKKTTEDTPEEYALDKEGYLREMFYDTKANNWIFGVDTSDILYPGCCHDTFEVDQSKVYYKRTCVGNGVCNDYTGYSFTREE